MANGLKLPRLRHAQSAPKPDNSSPNNLRFWDVATGKPSGALPIDSPWPLPFTWVNNHVIAVLDGNGARFWDTEQKRLLASLMFLNTHRDGDKITLEWLVTTPDGAFDASPGADKFLRWRVNGELLNKPSADVQRVPGLLSKILPSAP